MFRILLLAVVAATFAAGQITVSPTFDKSLQEGDAGSFSYKCQNGDPSSTEYPVWTNEAGDVIQTATGGGNERVYTTESVEPSPMGQLYVSRLTFDNVKITEDGTYRCELNGDYEERTVIVTIPISFPEMATESSQRMLIENNGRVTCTINSNPYPTVFWKVNGQFLSTTDDTDRFTMTTQMVTEPKAGTPGYEHAEIAILEVRDVVEQDTGSYECFATIDSTGDSDTLTIAVLVQEPPEWTVEPMNVQETEGSDISIQCAASGTPDPTYTWQDQMGAAIATLPGKYELVDDGEFFTILNLEAADDQVYTCIASNDAINSTYTTAIQKSIRVEVLIPPALNNQDNRTVMEGQDFSMDCIITRPDSTGVLSWRRGGITEDDIVNEGSWNLDGRVTVTSKDDGRTLTLSLSPSNYDHSGAWACFVESDAGDAHVTHYLSVESVPFVDRSETPSRVLSWPGNPINITCAINGYPYPVIRWYIRQGEHFYRVNETENIVFLPNQPKGVSVMAITPTSTDFQPYFCEGTNTQGDIQERIELVEAAFPSEPQNVRLIEVTSSTVRVVYDEPENDGGLDVEHYVVTYNSGFDSENISRNYDNITDVVVDGLSGSTRYEFFCAAVNGRGVGQYSMGKFVTTEAVINITVPDQPRILSEDESEFAEKYTLKWEPPQNNGGSAIQNYYIEYAQVDGPDAPDIGSRPADQFEVSYTETETVLQPLNENKYYFVNLHAVNAMGRSKAAQKIFKTRGGFVYPTEEPKRPEQQIGTLGTTEIVAIIVACLIILLILIDVCCFCMNDCGVLMFICVNCCGRSPPSSKDEIEMGEEEYGNGKAKAQPKSSLKASDDENCLTTNEITADVSVDMSEPGGTKPSSPPPGDGPPTYQPMENGKADDVEEPPAATPDTTPAAEAEAEPLMNKDGAV